ncbi:prostate stem cell antigen-like [Acipenser oxyrinchus oxyrinchus]|uniref:Prostate stem cell antigen-like n=1 Tax=Acipenser oxyrinchus oxyrinchus TaxID=40147 RepID=A0AAD8GEZ1_ACIOX|nr:prostate stem cell antigen-like [Acipenser oxyrinchus oxyrinchus]
MKTSLALLLLAFISSRAVEALSCYKCTASLSNDACNTNTQICTTEDTCMTTVITTLGINTITKKCATNSACNAAVASDVSVGALGGSKVTCCPMDLCNVNGSTTARLNVLLLGASAALLFLVSRITA